MQDELNQMFSVSLAPDEMEAAESELEVLNAHVLEEEAAKMPAVPLPTAPTKLVKGRGR